MERYERLGKNVALITLGNLATKIMSFLLIPLYTAVLTTSEYGIADLMTTTVNLLYPFCTLIISEAVMRFALDKEKDPSQVFSIGICITVTGFLAMLILSPLIRFIPTISSYYSYFILYYLTTTLHILTVQFVKGIDKIQTYTISGIIQTLCFIFLNIVFLLIAKMRIEGYLLAFILSSVLSTVYLVIDAKVYRYCIVPTKIDRNILRQMLQYAVPMIPNSISWWVSNSSDKYLITFFSGVALTGIYSVAQRIPSLFSTISTIFMSAWQISAVENFGGKDSKEFYGEIYRKYSSLNMVIVSILICGTKFLGGFLFSKGFFSGWKFVPVLLFAFLFHSMSSFLGTIYTAAKKTKMLFVSTLIAAIANIVLNCMLIPIWGVQGAGVATFISYFLIWIIRLIDTKKILPIDLALARDCLCYGILAAQIVLVLMDKPEAVISAVILLGVLCALNREFFMQMRKMTVRILNRVKRLDQ